MKSPPFWLLLAIALLSPFSGLAAEAAFQPKVMILTTYEMGADTGDKPGEFQYWVERFKLEHSLSVPGIEHPLRYNDDGVYAMVTGTGYRSGFSVIALGLDPRFDLTPTYWLIAGIAGVDPAKASVGSAAWAGWVVDAEYLYEIDGHDAPPDWPYGLFPLGATRPAEAPRDRFTWLPKGLAREIDPPLLAWAFNLTKDIPLPDNALLQKTRAGYTGYPNAQKPPFVLIGDTLGTTHFWHGPTLTQWANDWVKIYTKGKGDFVTTQCEDHSLVAALHTMGGSKRVDPRRLLVLRSASNYCMPPDGASVVESTIADFEGEEPSLDALVRVGGPVVREIVKNWDSYRTTLPGR